MRCPTCTTALSASNHEGVSLHTCFTCEGRFVDYPGLASILRNQSRPRSTSEQREAIDASATVANAAPDERSPLACPVCADSMVRRIHQYASGVWIDACEVHGIWLDAGEMQRLEAYAEAGVAGMRPEKPISNLAAPGTPRIATTPDAVDDLRRHDMYANSPTRTFLEVLDMIVGPGWL